MNELTEQDLLRTLWYAAWVALENAGSVAPEQVSSEDALKAASVFLVECAFTDSSAVLLLSVLPEFTQAFQAGWKHYTNARRQELWREEITAHLADLNFAGVEQVKYADDAYDQRNGQRWFVDAWQRTLAEMEWFAQHHIVLAYNTTTQQYEVKS